MLSESSIEELYLLINNNQMSENSLKKYFSSESKLPCELLINIKILEAVIEGYWRIDAPKL